MPGLQERINELHGLTRFLPDSTVQNYVSKPAFLNYGRNNYPLKYYKVENPDLATYNFVCRSFQKKAKESHSSGDKKGKLTDHKKERIVREVAEAEKCRNQNDTKNNVY